ncbi:MAG: hypothetical protein NVSMB23_00120 [Myxococcales bacterium]
MRGALVSLAFAAAAAVSTPVGAAEPAAVAAAEPSSVAAAEPPRDRFAGRALEIDLHAGYGFMVQPKVDHRGETFSRNGGPALGLGAVYRSSYFLSPALDVAFQPLYRSAGDVDLGASGGTVKSTGALRTLSVAAGVVFEVWKLRLGASIGSYRIFVRSSMRGQTLNAAEWDMGYAFSAGGFVWESPRVRIGIESRVGLITDAGTTYFTIGAFAAGDALRW